VGDLRAEDSGGTRYVHTIVGNDPGTLGATDLYVLGYLDDYRTLDASGQPTFY